MEGRAREAEQNFRNLHHQSSIEIQNLSHQNQELARQVNEMNMVFRQNQSSEELKAELDSVKAAHAAELANLHSQIGLRQKEVGALKQQVQEVHSQLEAAEGQKESLASELSKSKDISKSLESKVSALEQDATKHMPGKK